MGLQLITPEDFLKLTQDTDLTNMDDMEKKFYQS
jgi:hypothetical protein